MKKISQSLRRKRQPTLPLFLKVHSTQHTKEHLLRKPTVHHLWAAVLKAPVLANVLRHHPADQLLGLQKTHQTLEIGRAHV